MTFSYAVRSLARFPGRLAWVRTSNFRSCGRGCAQCSATAFRGAPPDEIPEPTRSRLSDPLARGFPTAWPTRCPRQPDAGRLA